MFDLATLHYVDKSFEAALLMGRIAHFLDPSIEQNAFLVSEILAQRESYEEALIPLASIQKDSSMYRDSVIQRSDILERAGRHEEAIAVLETELKRKPHSRIAFNLAEMYRMDDNYEDALATYNQAEFLGKKEGGLPDALWSLYYFRGITHHQLDNWPKAEADFLQALDLRPENPFVLNYLGYSWVDKEMHVKRALTMLEKALQIMPQSGHITDSVGWAYFKLGDFDMAVYYLERAAELMPYDPEINDHLGDAYWALKRYFEARYQWKRAINYAEEDRPAHQKIVESATQKLKHGISPEDIPDLYEDNSGDDDGANDSVKDNASDKDEGDNIGSHGSSDEEE
jgi:tetratricopeptide (TPR) repeat protein